MTIVDGVTALVSGVLIVVNASSQIELWQRKEYRWDRLRSHLLSSEFYPTLFSLATLGTVVSITALCFAVVNMTAATLTFSYMSLAAYALHYTVRFRQRGISRPELTAKAIVIIAVLATLELTLTVFLWQVFPLPLLGSAANALVLIICPLSIAAVNIPSAWQKRRIIDSAKTLRQKLNQLTVIGITGSFGKSSTKHFVYQLLLTQFPQTLATPGHVNTEIGVASDMLQQINPKTAIYIVEMGAYTPGEIAALAKLAQPSIGVITGISNQHLALFGSQDAIASAKWELIDNLPNDGVAVLNADTPALPEKAKALTLPTIWYSIKQPANIYASDIQLHARTTSFRLHISQNNAELTIPMPGYAMLSSVVAAAATAAALGMEASDIFSKIPTLKPFPQTMEIKSGKNSATIIDDSYSANEQGVHEALAAIQRFPEKDKRVVLSPLIELGKDAKKTHERISQALANIPAAVYINGTAHKAALKTHAPHLQFFSEPKKLVAAVSQNMSADTVILLEGRLPDVVSKELLPSSS